MSSQVILILTREENKHTCFFKGVVSFMTKEKSNHIETSEDNEIGNVL